MPPEKRNPAGGNGGVSEMSNVTRRHHSTPALFDVAGPRTEPDPAGRRRNLEEGRRTADTGADAVLANTPIGSRDLAEQTVRDLASEGVAFTADDVRERMCGHVLGAHPNSLSAVIRKAAADDVIRCVGVGTSTRPEARGRLLRVWRGSDHV